MRILMLHDQLGESEDTALRSEVALLRDAGVDVIEHVVNNEAASPFTVLGGVQLTDDAPWSRASEKAVSELCERFQPDVVHVYNFRMRLTPSVHRAARAAGAAVVQTLNDYRPICVGGGLSRNGRYCDDCVGRSPWRGVVRKCHRNSVVASAAAAHMVMRSRRRGVWERSVNAFITPSDFARDRFIAGGLPAGRIHVKRHFTADPGPSEIPPSKSRTAVFVGRLSREKGIDVLLAAWAMASKPEWRLAIAGDGPERHRLQEMAASLRGGCCRVQFIGAQETAVIAALLLRSRCLVQPSMGAETFGSSVIEAFAAGRPAIVSDSGGRNELVQDGVNGFQVASGDPVELAGAIDICFASGRMADRMGAGARDAWLENYSPQTNLKRLLQIYEIAVAHDCSVPLRASARAVRP